MTLSNFFGFYLPWSIALAVARTETVPIGATVLHFEGLQMPLVQSVLAVAGVLMARPLAPRRRQERGWAKQILVTIIMVIVALAWVVQSQPGVLFTFVVAIGLGFSGYALVETAGKEIENFVKRIFDRVTGAFGGSEREEQS